MSVVGFLRVLVCLVVHVCCWSLPQDVDKSSAVGGSNILSPIELESKGKYHIYTPYHRHAQHAQQAHASHRNAKHQHLNAASAQEHSEGNVRPLIATPEHWIQSLTSFHRHLDQITVNTRSSLEPAVHRARRAYLDMLQSFVLGNIYGRAEKSMKLDGSLQYTEYNATKRFVGEDMTYLGTTMIGVRRLQALEDLIVACIDTAVEGDIVETGVWRGGASIYAMAVLRSYVYSLSVLQDTTADSPLLPPNSVSKPHMATDRRLFLCDSFAGLPPGKKETHAGDVGWSDLTYLSVSDVEVVRHMQEFNLLDPRMVVVRGFFNETMPPLQKLVFGETQRRIALLRLDGDMYESTADVLYHLYGLVRVGGYVIVDDWDGFPAKDACLDFFKVHRIEVEIHKVDRWSVYFKKTADVEVQYWRYEKKQFRD